MERRDVALAIAMGLLLGGAAVGTNNFQEAGFVGYAASLASRFWYVGVAAIVLGALLGSRGLSQAAARLIGFVGVVWVAFLAGVPLLSFLGNVVAGPKGP